MWGKPIPIEGKCNSKLEIGDDYGDGTATMLCTLDPGHAGRHEEILFDGKARVEWDTVTWTCPYCGRVYEDSETCLSDDCPGKEIDCDGGIFPVDLSEEK